VGAADIEPDVTGQFRRGDVRHCTADLGRARRLLGFEPRVGWEAGIAELAAWAQGTKAVDSFAQADRELRDRGLVSGKLGRKTA
jgi:dTDP-L-rhamnose 4-epimerase